MNAFSSTWILASGQIDIYQKCLHLSYIYEFELSCDFMWVRGFRGFENYSQNKAQKYQFNLLLHWSPEFSAKDIEITFTWDGDSFFFYKAVTQ